jgi:hypothetical protein
MIIIFCYFRQFSAKKLAFFSKTNVMSTLVTLPTILHARAQHCQLSDRAPISFEQGGQIGRIYAY